MTHWIARGGPGAHRQSTSPGCARRNPVVGWGAGFVFDGTDDRMDRGCSSIL